MQRNFSSELIALENDIRAINRHRGSMMVAAENIQASIRDLDRDIIVKTELMAKLCRDQNTDLNKQLTLAHTNPTRASIGLDKATRDFQIVENAMKGNSNMPCIAAVKALREANGIVLKEAKDLFEDVLYENWDRLGAISGKSEQWILDYKRIKEFAEIAAIQVNPIIQVNPKDAVRVPNEGFRPHYDPSYFPTPTEEDPDDDFSDDAQDHANGIDLIKDATKKVEHKEKW